MLVPEIVKHDGLEIGRFEVTRAQFAAFDSVYRYEPGTGNHPANGVSFEQAQAYVAWLSGVTGAPHRLGTVAELKRLYESAEGEENTLDYWAGYAPNPDDAERLAEKIAELPGSAPLLKAVGSLPGRGAAPVYDLGGNVAEWAVAEDGGGKLLGGSADRPADAKSKGVAAAVAYRGLRVVRGERP